jgi:oligosaccharide translocation protein RFT1
VGAARRLIDTHVYAECAAGSLVARIIFQPLEETLLLHFSRDLSSASTSSILYMAIHFSSHLLLLLPAFIPPLLPAVLPILLPRRYRNTSAPRTLEVYLKAYIPLLSLNGILEAFHASSASPKQIARQARWMIASSAAFVFALWSMIEWSDIPALGIHLGKEEALIYASCVTTLVRITYAYWHVRRFFTCLLPSQGGEDVAVFSAKLRSVKELLPRWQVWVAVLGSGAGLRWVQNAVAWQSSWKQWALLVGTGGILGMINLGIM